MTPVLESELATSLSLSLPEFKSSKNLNRVNQIEKIVELTPLLASEPIPSIFMPQISITQNWRNKFENERGSVNTKAIRDFIVNNIDVSKK
ncbi:hypothetical protein H5410_063210 [Solanum commersonii]|uniref:Uncharacterized protein n=1 Tax=Solanum commersonii TaxID=4109 RepID=A0A9J5WDT1_SOLCO|nr:hypothetical protein H5410_063210 [Solanum commersonii]